MVFFVVMMDESDNNNIDSVNIPVDQVRRRIDVPAPARRISVR